MRVLLSLIVFIGKGLLLLLGLFLILGGGTCFIGDGFNAAWALGLVMLLIGGGLLALVLRSASPSLESEGSTPPGEEQ